MDTPYLAPRSYLRCFQALERAARHLAGAHLPYAPQTPFHRGGSTGIDFTTPYTPALVLPLTTPLRGGREVSPIDASPQPPRYVPYTPARTPYGAATPAATTITSIIPSTPIEPVRQLQPYTPNFFTPRVAGANTSTRSINTRHRSMRHPAHWSGRAVVCCRVRPLATGELKMPSVVSFPDTERIGYVWCSLIRGDRRKWFWTACCSALNRSYEELLGVDDGIGQALEVCHVVRAASACGTT